MIAAPLHLDVRRGAIDRLADLLANGWISAQGRVAVAVGSGPGDGIAAGLDGLAEVDLFHVQDGSVDDARELAVRASFCDAVVGIGGGQTIDVAKYAATLCGMPMIAIPTSLAHDGLASPVASLQHNGRKGSYGARIPVAVLVDLEYVHRSPIRWHRAGIGEALSNLSALQDWWLAHEQRGEAVDGVAEVFARTGAEAVLHHDGSVASDDFLETLARSHVLSGLAMSAAGTSQPCSGACHEISHALDELHPNRARHGEQVAVGALFASHLRGDEFGVKMNACMLKHDVPRLPHDIGITAEEFCAAVEVAPRTRPHRFTVLEHLAMDADQIRKRVGEFVDTYDR